jgi:hypothetical protein
MRMKRPLIKASALFLALLLGAPQWVIAQSAGEDKPFKQEELDQLVAPIALYPDSLLTQILMASTYPLEVVQADRWAKQNKDVKGDALAKGLEAQPWDPSVKSLVNFPQVLTMMSEKLDWTQRLGDAFLAQQKDVMGTVQKLRAKAQESGNLKTTKEQVVKVEQETIIIEPASPEVIYVPAYNPTVVYGTWAYPAYPPYPVYPPGYVAGSAFTFAAGVAVGAAWGYAWGNANWHGGDVNINVNQNTNINNNIDRSKYQNKVTSGQGGQGQWQHNPESRKGVAYRDQGTAQKYNKGGSSTAGTRDAYRGRQEQGRQDLSKDAADRSRGGQQMDRSGGSPGQTDRGGALSGTDRGGSATREASNRGNQSMSSSRGSGGGGSVSRPSGGGGGGTSRGAGGGGRGGGGRR